VRVGFVLWWKIKKGLQTTLIVNSSCICSLHDVMKITNRELGQNSDKLNANCQACCQVAAILLYFLKNIKFQIHF
jgi:hypothetical protein